MTREEALAEKVAKKASEALEPLRREMAIYKWPDDLRAIMLRAVAATAENMARDAEQGISR
jgi:hypothetical protein